MCSPILRATGSRGRRRDAGRAGGGAGGGAGEARCPATSGPRARRRPALRRPRWPQPAVAVARRGRRRGRQPRGRAPGAPAPVVRQRPAAGPSGPSGPFGPERRTRRAAALGAVAGGADRSRPASPPPASPRSAAAPKAAATGEDDDGGGDGGGRARPSAARSLAGGRGRSGRTGWNRCRRSTAAAPRFNAKSLVATLTSVPCARNRLTRSAASAA